MTTPSPTQSSNAAPPADTLANLVGFIERLGTNPPRRRHAAIWDEAFATYSEVLSAGYGEKQTRRAVLAALNEHALYLLRGDTTNATEALRVNFCRKLQRWQTRNANLAAVEDLRLRKRAASPYAFTDEERNYLTMLAKHYNNSDLAWREFLASDKARPETKGRFQRDPSRKRIHTPKSVREWLDPLRENQQTDVRGKRTAKLNGAHHDLDPRTLHAGDADMSDDKTLDLYWWDDTPGGVWFGQGQLLVWIDERSWLIQSFTLISDDAYNGFDIRNSWTEKARKWGLPRKRLHLEMGIWKSAKVFKGTQPRSNGHEPVGTEETEMGLRRLGIRFRHSLLPRGKLIERVFGSLTDLTQMFPGYAGRNQQLDRYEEVYRKSRLVKSGQEHPGELGFLHRSQLAEHLNDLIVKLNNTHKYGEYHTFHQGGPCRFLTPQQAYEEYFTDSLVFIPPEVEHLLRDNKIIETVGANGLRLKYGNNTFRYRNSEQLGRLKGQQVCVWFNPEDPSTVSVTDLDGLNPFVVPLEPKLSHDATPEEMARANESIARFESYQRSVSRTLAPVFRQEFQSRLFRYPVIDSTTSAVSQELELQRGEIQGQQREEAKRVRASQAAASSLNIRLSRSAAQRPEAAASLKRLGKFLEEEDVPGDCETTR